MQPHIGEQNYSFMFTRIEEIVVKTILSAENLMFKSFQANVKFRDSCFELLGFDILLDNLMNPWLLEVNTSPSLATDAQLDFDLKSKVITEALNIVGLNRESEEEKVRRFKINSKLESFLSAGASRLRKKQSGNPELAKTKKEYLLTEVREELARAKDFKLVFPSSSVDSYTRFFEEDRVNNRILRNE